MDYGSLNSILPQFNTLSNGVNEFFILSEGKSLVRHTWRDDSFGETILDEVIRKLQETNQIPPVFNTGPIHGRCAWIRRSNYEFVVYSSSNTSSSTLLELTLCLYNTISDHIGLLCHNTLSLKSYIIHDLLDTIVCDGYLQQTIAVNNDLNDSYISNQKGPARPINEAPHLDIYIDHVEHVSFAYSCSGVLLPNSVNFKGEILLKSFLNDTPEVSLTIQSHTLPAATSFSSFVCCTSCGTDAAPARNCAIKRLKKGTTSLLRYSGPGDDVRSVLGMCTSLVCEGNQCELRVKITIPAVVKNENMNTSALEMLVPYPELGCRSPEVSFSGFESKNLPSWKVVLRDKDGQYSSPYVHCLLKEVFNLDSIVVSLCFQKPSHQPRLWKGVVSLVYELINSPIMGYSPLSDPDSLVVLPTTSSEQLGTSKKWFRRILKSGSCTAVIEGIL